MKFHFPSFLGEPCFFIVHVAGTLHGRRFASSKVFFCFLELSPPVIYLRLVAFSIFQH